MSNRVVLVRHASAGKREHWSGEDHLRPLDKRGQKQAHRLVAALLPLGIDRVCSSPYVRCVQTVEPLAAALDVQVEEREELAEGASPKAVLGLLNALEGATPTLCTHGDVVELLVGPALALEKGAARIVETTGAAIVPGQYIPSPEV
jgi:8-oxo-dGTP diphosphatase